MATATKTARKATTKPAAKKAAPAKATAKRVVGKDRTAAAKKVVALRNKKMSWGQIAAELKVAPRTTRRLYDEVKGEGAHHGLLPGKGGRQIAA